MKKHGISRGSVRSHRKPGAGVLSETPNIAPRPLGRDAVLSLHVSVQEADRLMNALVEDDVRVKMFLFLDQKIQEAKNRLQEEIHLDEERRIEEERKSRKSNENNSLVDNQSAGIPEEDIKKGGLNS